MERGKKKAGKVSSGGAGWSSAQTRLCGLNKDALPVGTTHRAPAKNRDQDLLACSSYGKGSGEER